MFCLCCFDGDFGSFQIVDFVDYDYVWVLVQEGVQCLGEVYVLVWVDVDLVDVFQVDFYRVFSGGDVDVGGIEDVQIGVQ